MLECAAWHHIIQAPLESMLKYTIHPLKSTNVHMVLLASQDISKCFPFNLTETWEDQACQAVRPNVIEICQRGHEWLSNRLKLLYWALKPCLTLSPVHVSLSLHVCLLSSLSLSPSLTSLNLSVPSCFTVDHDWLWLIQSIDSVYHLCPQQKLKKKKKSKAGPAFSKPVRSFSLCTSSSHAYAHRPGHWDHDEDG